jgi:hypothetical protein
MARPVFNQQFRIANASRQPRVLRWCIGLIMLGCIVTWVVMAVKTYAPRTGEGGVRERATGIASSTKIAASVFKKRGDVKAPKAVAEVGDSKGPEEKEEAHHHQLSWAEESRAAASVQAGGESATESERSYNQCNPQFGDLCFFPFLFFSVKVFR